MCSQELLEYIGLFREKAEQSKLVVFVGAGVSCNVKGLPDWNDLIQNMAKAISYSKCTSCRHKGESCEEACLLKNDYSADEFLKIPQYVFNADNALYDEVLAKSIPTDMLLDVPLSSAIFDINPVHIITTNYDQLLESSKNVFREQYQVIVSDKDLLSTDKGKYIIKMHGDFSSPESIVLKEQDYLDYSQKHVLLELFIKSLLTDHVVLFLGYSLNDYNIKLIISWLNYMRSQNGALDEGRKVGYIVLDQAQIDKVQESYFNCNNIGVININSMKPIQNIPASLSSEKGQRLFSFLRVIADSALEEGMASIEKSVRLMAQHSFVSYKHILKSLYIKNYDITDGQLRLFSNDDYTRLAAFMEAGTEEANKLKQLLVNAGIVLIVFFATDPPKSFYIGEFSENSLFQDSLYSLYMLNKYDEIKSLLERDFGSLSPLKTYFYQSVVEGYSTVLANYNDIDISQLNVDQKVAYLHNSAVVEALKTSRFDSSKVKYFVQNIVSSKDRELFDDYLDIYNGSTEKRLSIQTALEKLKKDVYDKGTLHVGSTSCGKIYDIKRLVVTEYFFYYNNHILYQGFSNLRDFFRPYIEAIICSNSDTAAAPSHFGDMEIGNIKYHIDRIDYDIITKFISSRDLSTFIATYDVKQLNANTHDVEFLVESFKNLCHSVVVTQTYGFRQSSLITLSNIILLLNLVTLGDNDKTILETSIEELFSNEVITQILFSTDWPDFRLTLQVLSQLCSSLPLVRNIEVVRRIITSKNFFDYAANVNVHSLRQLIVAFLPSHDKCISVEIQNIIDKTDCFQKKVVLLRLLYKHIADEAIQKTYQNLLSENFLQLPTDAIYDLVFSKWISPTSEAAEELLKGILKMNEERPHGVYSFPDPVESTLECAYLMYINGIIKDISILKELAEGRPHLQFLLDQETFDYTQVDFSNYMWENFMRHKKYMECFIAHKDTIVPLIKARIVRKEVSKAEEKILYGVLLDKDELWDA